MRLRRSFVLLRASLIVAASISTLDGLGAQAVGSRDMPSGLLPGQLAQSGPRFLLDRGTRMVPLDVARTPVLRRLLALELEGVPAREALKTIAREAGMELLFSDQVVPESRRVRLRASAISVAAALTDVLLDAGVDVVFTSSGSAVLVRRPVGEVLPVVGTIAGRITDAATGLGVPGAQLRVEGTGLARVSEESGRYVISGVPAGQQRLTVRRLGYEPETRDVAVGDGQTLVVDIALRPAATRLTEVVTTVTGDQRRLELGNALARVHADSVAATAQVRNLPELIAGRAAGVVVFFPNGVVGQAPRIRIRGTNSLTVRNDPLVIVDGARVDNSPAIFSTYLQQSIFAVTPQTGRLADLNPDEIESIEIVKGPSAATLYGTDAANGVIVVTTKKGRSGPARWTIQTDFGIVQPRGRWNSNYFSWGHTPSGDPVQCTIVDLAASACVVDSLTTFNPLEDAPNSPLANGNLQKLGIQVTGGGARLGYFVSGEYSRELGVLQLNGHEEAFLKQFRGVSSIPDEQRDPNLAERINLRGNVSAQLGAGADLSVNVGLVRNDARVPRDGLVLDGASFGRGTADTLQQWFANRRPGFALAQTNEEEITRTTASATFRWQPRSWLRTRGTVGIDYTNRQYNTLIKRGDTPLAPAGLFLQQSGSGALYSADVGATAEFRLTGNLLSRTSVGGQLNRNRASTTVVAASNLAPGAETAAGAATLGGETIYNETVVAGSYVEQMLGYRDRLFVTGAVRFDGASSFGENFSTVAYPKGGISWLALLPGERSIIGQSSLRLRSAYGASGVQPAPIATVSRSQLFTGVVDGASTSAAAPLAIGNADLRPERQTEIEGGADLDMLGGRVRLEVTAYHRESSDALINQPLPLSFGLGAGASRQINVGKVRNRGIEALLSFRPIDNEVVSWDVQLNGSSNDNELLRLAPDIPVLGSGISRNVPGFPINGLWDRPILGFADANGDGVIAESEVTLGDTAIFLGPVTPKRSLTAGSTLTLFRGRVSLSALIDRRSGFVRLDGAGASRCDLFLGSCREINDPTTPFDRQAAAAVAGGSAFVQTGYVHDGSYTAFRELSVTFQTPAIARMLRASSAALTLAGRNLHVWTDYPGVDVESTNAPGQDFFVDNPALPPSRYFVARARLTF